MAVVRHHPETGARHLDLLKWGLLPYWTKEPTSARPMLDSPGHCVHPSLAMMLLGDDPMMRAVMIAAVIALAPFFWPDIIA